MAQKSSGNAKSARHSRKPTIKQEKFAKYYADPQAANGNGTLAAKMAGYRGDTGQLGVQASRNLRNAKVQRSINDILQEAGCTHELVALRLREAIDATDMRVFLSKQGKVIYSKKSADHKVRLQAIGFILRLLETESKQGEFPPSLPPLDPQSLPEEQRSFAEKIRELSPVDRFLMHSIFQKLERVIELRKQAASETDHPSDTLVPPHGAQANAESSPTAPAGAMADEGGTGVT